MLESDLEKALVAQIEKFLLELGRGFMFVGAVLIVCYAVELRFPDFTGLLFFV